MSFRRVIILFILLEAIVFLWYFFAKQNQHSINTLASLPSEKIYVAVEEDENIAVINLQNNVVKYISLDEAEGSSIISFMPHNVQVSPDGKSVWVTANVSSVKPNNKSEGFLSVPKAYAHEDESNTNMNSNEKNSKSVSMQDIEDEVVVINPMTDNIVKRIPIGKDLHLAHVIVTPGERFAYVTSQSKDLIVKINMTTFKVEKQISLKKGSSPHGIRVSPDGENAYVALMGENGVADISTSTDNVTYLSFKGKAVQTGITPDGKFALATVFDSKQLAVYDVVSKSMSFIDLPSESRGPLQVYPMPDSRYVYVADQGYYFGQPQGNLVYKIDLYQKKVISQIKAGTAPHGVVVAKDGRNVYVTNLVSGDVSVIDTSSNKEVRKINVGRSPNGISIWSKDLGGTP